MLANMIAIEIELEVVVVVVVLKNVELVVGIESLLQMEVGM